MGIGKQLKKKWSKMVSKNILQKRVKIKTPVASLVKSTNSERINHANVAQTQKIGKEGALVL